MRNKTNNTNGNETMTTDWKELEKSETHILFRYRRGDAVGEICRRNGEYRIVGYREATPEGRRSKAITEDQAASIATHMRALANCEILVDHGAI